MGLRATSGGRDVHGHGRLHGADAGRRAARAVEKRDRYVDALERGTTKPPAGRSCSGWATAVCRCSRARSAAVAGRGRDPARSAPQQDVPVRIGIHVGEVVVEAERLTGDAVNIAARVESFAAPAPSSSRTPPQSRSRIAGRSEMAAARLVSFQERRTAARTLCASQAHGLVVPERSDARRERERRSSRCGRHCRSRARCSSDGSASSPSSPTLVRLSTEW